MKKIKKTITLILLGILMPQFVQAGSISFNNPQKINENQYTFTITAQSISLNYLSGTFNIENGKITNISMANNWINKTNTNNTFYFEHDGLMTGDYLIATVTVTMTGNSVYSASNISFGKNTCVEDKYHKYYNPEGKIVDKTTYQDQCEKNNDPSLKNIIPSVGNLSPTFSKDTEIYNLNVDKDVNEVNFIATPTNEKTKIISGTTCKLTNNLTYCYIVSEAQNGQRKTYTIKVAKPTTENFNQHIDNFVVHNGSITEEFRESKTTYNLIPDKDADSIYFSFAVDGTNMNSQKCNAKASICTLSITFGNQKRLYTFNLIDENKSSSNSVAIVDQSTNKSATSSNTTKNSSKEEKNEANETIDPIEHNKNKQEQESQEEQNSENENKNDEKPIWLKIASVVFAVIAGIGIGLYVRKR